MARIVFKTNPMIAPIMGRMTGLDFAEAATLPFTYAASWHALVGLARLAPGERLRVRADAGFEHAALAIARRRGAELVGEREDADVLLDGRSDGSLTAELEAMAAFGRCVTIARDVSTGDQLPLASLSHNLAFFHSDLTQAIEACPERVSAVVAALRASADPSAAAYTISVVGSMLTISHDSALTVVASVAVLPVGSAGAVVEDAATTRLELAGTRHVGDDSRI